MGGAEGQASDIAIHAKEILRVRERLNNIYKKHTKKHTVYCIYIFIYIYQRMRSIGFFKT